MAANDSDVQLPNAGSPLADTSQVTTSVGIVQRQRVSIGDPVNPNGLAAVDASLGLSVAVTSNPTAQLGNLIDLANLRLNLASGDFVPIETPDFLIGV